MDCTGESGRLVGSEQRSLASADVLPNTDGQRRLVLPVTLFIRMAKSARLTLSNATDISGRTESSGARLEGRVPCDRDELLLGDRPTSRGLRQCAAEQHCDPSPSERDGPTSRLFF